MASLESGFTDLLVASCADMLVQNGTLAPGTFREKTHLEIEIAIPGERAAAEVAYQTANGLQQRRSVSDRHVSVIPACQPHQWTWQRETDLTVFLLSPSLVEEIAYESGMRRVDLIEDYAALDPLIWNLGREVRSELRRYRQVSTTLLESVAMVLARHVLMTYASSPLPTSTDACLPRFKLRRAIEYIRENMEKEISFRDIASHLQMSPFHFSRMFRHATGEPPHQYIMRCRMDRAKALLVETRLPIVDVAFEVGYKSQSHFTTCFGKLVGVTPAAFRGWSLDSKRMNPIPA
jgi:AraC family transcriptional regulator